MSRYSERPHRMSGTAGFALLADGTIVAMAANAAGKLPSKKVTPWVQWHPKRAVLETLSRKPSKPTRAEKREASKKGASK